MTARKFPLLLAFALSLLLHATAGLLWSSTSRPQPRAATARPALAAVLALPQSQTGAQPALFMPEAAPPPVPRVESSPASSGQKHPAAPRKRVDAAGDVVGRASEQVARELLYPPEAIARGLEGETLVLLFLDESGNAIAARVEQSSGHALLDEAAIRAARSVRSLPGNTAREFLLPVRFRLR
jgi:protein TonB